MRNKKIYSIPRNGLVGEYLLNGTAVDTNDGTKNNGTATNVTYVTTEKGYQKQAGSFNDASSIISTSGSINVGNTTTISVWYKFNGLSGANTLVGINERVGTPNDAITLYVAGNSINTEYANSAGNLVYPTVNFTHNNNWVHLIAIYSNNTTRYIINGIEQTVTTPTITSKSITRPLTIGASTFGVNTYFYGGNIQGVRVYNRVLTSLEIQNLYLEGLRQLGNGADNIMSGAVAYYDFNGDANDIIGGNNGTVTGATLTTDRFGIANRAYSFDGTTNKIEIPNGTYLDFTTEYNFNFDIYLNSLPTSGNLYNIYYRGNTAGTGAQLEFLVYNNSGTHQIGFVHNLVFYNINYTLSTSVWFNFNVRYIGGIIYVYIDGVLIGQVTASSQPGSSNKTGCFGYNNLANIRCLNGKIGRPILGNKALSADEVKELYNLSKIKYLYPFKKTFPLNLNDGKVLHLAGDNTTTTLYDISGNGDATISSTPVIKRQGQHKYISLTAQSITWSSRTIGTSLCWEKVSGKWELQVNPAYITATGITSTTKDLANIYITTRTLSINEIQNYKYSTFIS